MRLRIAVGSVRRRLRSNQSRSRSGLGSRSVTAIRISRVSPAQIWSVRSYIHGLNQTVIAL